jgi:hypothetical protein
MGATMACPVPLQHRRRYVDRILEAATPFDLPVEQPTKCELVINLETARGVGLDWTTSQSILVRADRVIQSPTCSRRSISRVARSAMRPLLLLEVPSSAWLATTSYPLAADGS